MEIKMSIFFCHECDKYVDSDFVESVFHPLDKELIELCCIGCADKIVENLPKNWPYN